MSETMELATTFGRITDEALDQLRQSIGRQVRRGQPYIEELNADAIRHFAYGIGDCNPLWIDRDYAAATPHGMLAPPTALFAMDKILSGYVSGLPGVHAMFAGTTFRWLRRLRAGDRLRGTAKLKDLIERPSKFAGRSVQQVYEITFTDQDGETVAVTESYCFRTERDAARERGKYSGASAEAASWNADQLAEIGAAYRKQEEVRRGARPRYIDEVTVGEELPPLLKGPYTATTAVSYLLGWGGLYVRSHGHAFQLYEDHPALAIPNEWGVPEPPERVHWDQDLAQRVGVPGAYDYGPERVAWMGHVVTDWMGDDGFLAELDVQVRKHNLIGDLVTASGTVAEVDTETRRVRLELHASDHRGDESARGSAVVVLPERP
ncbi:MAG: acyl dehydratase [Streptosporangiales bacterium]|nr:acyl dehydratase [Streptosporangiales bacterium]